MIDPAHIAVSPDGVDEPRTGAGIDLVLEVVDVGVDGVELHVLLKAPNRFDDGGAGGDPAGAAHEMFEEAELGGREAHLISFTKYLAGGRVQNEGVRSKDGQERPVSPNTGKERGGAPAVHLRQKA